MRSDDSRAGFGVEGSDREWGAVSGFLDDHAEVPGGPFKPNLMLNLLIGLGLGLLAGIGAALALEFLNDTVKTPEDVREKLHLPSLGVIPMKKGADALADELKDQSSAISEA